MVTILIVSALGYLLVKAYAAFTPRILENNLRKNKKLVKAIQDLDEAYDAIDKNIDDFCARHPIDCLDAARRRHEYDHAPDDESRREMEEAHRRELQKIADAGKAFARQNMSEVGYAQLCAEIDERLSGEWYLKKAKKEKQEEEERNERRRKRRLQYYDNDDTYSMCSWCGDSLAGRSRDLGGYCSPKCRAEAKQGS